MRGLFRVMRILRGISKLRICILVSCVVLSLLWSFSIKTSTVDMLLRKPLMPSQYSGGLNEKTTLSFKEANHNESQAAITKLEYERRLSRVKEHCLKRKYRDSRKTKRLVVVEKHKLLFCDTGKTGITTFVSVILMLFGVDPSRFEGKV